MTKRAKQPGLEWPAPLAPEEQCPVCEMRGDQPQARFGMMHIGCVRCCALVLRNTMYANHLVNKMAARAFLRTFRKCGGQAHADAVKKLAQEMANG